MDMSSTNSTSFAAALTVAALLGPSASLAARHGIARVNPDAGMTVYTNAKWLDRSEGRLRFVAGDRRAVDGVFVASEKVAKPAQGTRIVDLGGAFVIPPFGEAHNHNLDGPWTLGYASRYVEAGVFYVKNPNNIASMAELTATLLSRPGTLDAVFAHAGLSIAGGHPEGLYRSLAPRFGLDPDALDGVGFFGFESVSELEERWPEVLAAEPDFIKLYLVDAAGEGTAEPHGLAPPVFRRAVELAHESGLRTTVHVESAADLALAVDAGADESAHLPGRSFRYGMGPEHYRISEELARRMAASGFVTVTTTAVTSAKFGDAARLDEIKEMQRRNLAALHAAGAPLAIGTDVYAWTTEKEIETLRSLGAIPDSDLLELWIDTPSRSIYPGRAIGCLAPGCEASFLALDCDPFADFSCTSKIRQRVKQGARLSDE